MFDACNSALTTRCRQLPYWTFNTQVLEWAANRQSRVYWSLLCIFLPFSFCVLISSFNTSFYLYSSALQEKYKEVKARNSQLLKMLQQGESELNKFKILWGLLFLWQRSLMWLLLVVSHLSISERQSRNSSTGRRTPTYKRRTVLTGESEVTTWSVSFAFVLFL